MFMPHIYLRGLCERLFGQYLYKRVPYCRLFFMENESRTLYFKYGGRVFLTDNKSSFDASL